MKCYRKRPLVYKHETSPSINVCKDDIDDSDTLRVLLELLVKVDSMMAAVWLDGMFSLQYGKWQQAVHTWKHNKNHNFKIHEYFNSELFILIIVLRFQL